MERVNKRKLKWKPLIIPGRHETKQITIHLIWRAPPACWKTLWVPHQTLLLCHRFLGIHVSFCTSKCTLLLDGAPSYCVGREFRHSLQMMLCSWRQQAPLFFKHAKCFVKLLWFANPCQTRSECCFSWVPKPYTLQEAFANAYVWPSPSQDRKGALVLQYHFTCNVAYAKSLPVKIYCCLQIRLRKASRSSPNLCIPKRHGTRL